MSASQLSIYNEALRLCEERRLATLTEARKPRLLLDDVWNDEGILACLEEGDWNFALRTISAVYDPTIQSGFGYLYAFAHPDDWLRTAGIAVDPYFENTLTRYSDERGYWWADLNTIFVRYVSSDSQYGMNLTLWPQSFKLFAGAHFASKIIGSLTHDEEKIDKVMKARGMALKSALGKDGLNEPPGFFPRGNLSRARRGQYYGAPSRNGRG